MNLAIALERWNPREAGSGRWPMHAACRLAARGHRVTLLVGYQAPDTTPPTGLDYRLAPRPATRPYPGPQRYAAWVKSQFASLRAQASGRDAPLLTLAFVSVVAADVVHPWRGALAQQLAQVAAPPPRARQTWASRLGHFLHTARDPARPHRRTLAELERQMTGDAALGKVAALTAEMAAQWRRHYALPAEKVVMLPPVAVAAGRLRVDAPAIRRRVRNGFGVAPDEVVYLFLSDEPARHGAAAVLTAFAQVARQRTHVTLMLAGTAEYAWQVMAAELGVREHVRMIGTTNQHDDLYAAADVLVTAPPVDPLGAAVVEALGSGLPAITTADDGAAALVLSKKDAPAGRVVAGPAGPEALAAAMLELADAHERRRAAAAAESLRPQLTMDHHLDALEALLAEVGVPAGRRSSPAKAGPPGATPF
ncbi:MAG: glycosyltransferase family 4 protein [Phycisphaeraceae bacterium]